MSRPLRSDGSEADRLTRAAGASSAVLLATACATQVAAYASFFNLTPLFPEVGADLGMDAGALGALVGFGGIVSLLAQLPAGSGGDTFGRRPFFAVGLVLASLGLLLRWQAYAPVTLLLGQVAAGAALGIISTNAFALAAEGFTARRQPQSIGIVNISVNIGQVVGYLIAGTLGALVGWRALSLNMVLLPGCVLLVILFVPGLAAWTGSHPRAPRPTERAAIAGSPTAPDHGRPGGADAGGRPGRVLLAAVRGPD